MIKKLIYIKQPPFRYCGQCQIKVITEFFANQNLDNYIDRKLVDYSPNLRSKWTGFLSTSTIHKAIIGSGLDVIKLDRSDYITNIKKEIDGGKLILMTIGHGYINNKKFFNIINGALWQHYISVWGYDDNGVYIYDSSVWEDENLNYEFSNLYISWEIFIKSYNFAVNKLILSIGKNDEIINKRISCVIPIYNEKDRIMAVVNELQKVNYIDEIVCVDDGSSDADYTNYIGKINKVKILKKENGGKASALKLGIDHCKNDDILFCDADLEGLDFVDISIGVQKYINKKLDMLVFRRKNSKRRLKFLKLDLLISGERVMSKEAALGIFAQEPKDFEFDLMSNIYIKQNNKLAGWIFSNGTNTYKFQKRGFWSGIAQDFKMYKGIGLLRNNILTQINEIDIEID